MATPWPRGESIRRLAAWALTASVCLCLGDERIALAQDGPNQDATATARREESGEPEKTGFERFDLVLQRNIFDPERRPVRPQSERAEGPPPEPPFQRIALVGVYLDEHRTFALFDGTSSDYKVTRETGESIAGFELAKITTDNVTLRKDDREIELRVGTGLRRPSEGEWELTTETGNMGGRPSPSSSGSGEATSSSGATGDARADVMQRLMERRRQETER